MTSPVAVAVAADDYEDQLGRFESIATYRATLQRNRALEHLHHDGQLLPAIDHRLRYLPVLQALIMMLPKCGFIGPTV